MFVPFHPHAGVHRRTPLWRAPVSGFVTGFVLGLALAAVFVYALLPGVVPGGMARIGPATALQLTLVLATCHALAVAVFATARATRR